MCFNFRFQSALNPRPGALSALPNLAPLALPPAITVPSRSVVKWSMRKGKRKSVGAVLKRFKRLHWWDLCAKNTIVCYVKEVIVYSVSAPSFIMIRRILYWICLHYCVNELLCNIFCSVEVMTPCCLSVFCCWKRSFYFMFVVLRLFCIGWRLAL